MTRSWQTVKFGEILTPNSRPYQLGPDEDARLVGMRLYGLGPFFRERKPALRIAKKAHFVIRSGDVIYNKLFAWKGTFGVVPPELDGMFVSDKFPTYEADRTRVEPSFLCWYFRHRELWEQAKAMSTGSAALSKLTLNPPKFLQLEMPLPTIEEQRRIVAKLDSALEHVQQACMRRAPASQLAMLMVKSAAAGMLRSPNYQLVSVASLVGDGGIRNGKSVRPSEVGSGARCLLLSSMRNGRVDTSDSKAVPLSEREAFPFLVRRKDVFVMRGSGSKGLVGQAGLVAKEVSNVIFPDLFIRLCLPVERVLPEFFVEAWNSPVVRAGIEGKAKTTSGIWKVNQGHIAETTIPLPAVAEQQLIVEALDRLRGRVDQLRVLQTEAETTLDALMPALLDRAFRGEL